jgi:hypothetical protein
MVAAGRRPGGSVGVPSGRRRLGRWRLGGGGLQRGMRWSEIVAAAAAFFSHAGCSAVLGLAVFCFSHAAARGVAQEILRICKALWVTHAILCY